MAFNESYFDASTVVAIMPWLNKTAAGLAADLMMSRAGADLLLVAVHDDLRAGPMHIWNTVISKTNQPFIVYCAEDAFAGRYWLRFGLETLKAPGAGLLAFNDGKWFGQLAAFGLVRRCWLDPIYGGLLFHPGYAQHFGDTELTLIARQQGALVYNPNAVLIEVDHYKDQREVNVADQSLFNERSATGFGKRINNPQLNGIFTTNPSA